MEAQSLVGLGSELLATAHRVPAGRAARTLHGGHNNKLRQTLVALRQDEGLAEHNAPGEATLQVLEGRVRLFDREQSWEGAAGDIVVIPQQRHSLEALTDAVVLLTVIVEL